MPDRTNPFLILQSIGKTFASGVTALDRVNLTVNEGDFMSLLGPSGCGKSTALRIIAGLSSPTSGVVDWRGAPLEQNDIGFVFQEPTLLPWASVYDKKQAIAESRVRVNTGNTSVIRERIHDPAVVKELLEEAGL